MFNNYSMIIIQWQSFSDNHSMTIIQFPYKKVNLRTENRNQGGGYFLCIKHYVYRLSSQRATCHWRPMLVFFDFPSACGSPLSSSPNFSMNAIPFYLRGGNEISSSANLVIRILWRTPKCTIKALFFVSSSERGHKWERKQI